MLKKLKAKGKKFYAVLGIVIVVSFVGFMFYYNSDKQVVLRDVKNTYGITDGEMSGEYSSNDKKVINTMNNLSYSDYIHGSLKDFNELNNEFDSSANRFHDYENVVDKMEFRSSDNKVIRSYEKGNLIKSIDIKKEKEKELLDAGFNKDNGNLVYKFTDKTPSEKLIINNKGDMIFKSDVASIKLSNTGKMSCQSASTSDCSDAKNVTSITDAGRQLQVMLFNMHDYDRQIVLDTSNILGIDLAPVNEIVDFTKEEFEDPVGDAFGDALISTFLN